MNPLDITDDYPKDKSPGADDSHLWEHVTQDVKPLKKKGGVVAPKSKASSSGPALVSPEAARADAASPKAKARKASPGDHEVDGQTRRKLKSGDYPIDYTLDLHGLTQPAAHKRLRETVSKAYIQQWRCLLIVTGKGRGQEGGSGVLKREVPLWLQESGMREIVLRVEPAQPRHGGSGALYVLLRRKRTSTHQ